MGTVARDAVPGCSGRTQAQATHTDGHAGWSRTLLPCHEQVLHLHLALKLWGVQALVMTPRSCHSSHTPQTAPAWPRALTSAFRHLDLQELLSMVGDGIRGSGHRAE